MAKKTLDTVVKDIYSLFKKDTVASEDNLEQFAQNVKMMLRDRLASYGTPRKPTLRMSNIGAPFRKVWYELTGAPKKDLDAATQLKFLYGDIIEELLIFLTKEAGHEVTDQQKEVEINGVLGHMDCKIDGHVVDVKSASKYAFKKFSEGTLYQDDSFGYIPQLAGYNEAEGGDKDAAFLAMCKETGELALLKINPKVLALEMPSDTIDNHRSALASESPPERCYPDEPMGQSGNRKLGMNCKYCPYKEHCWSDANDGEGLRTFQYAYGEVDLTTVVREPNVEEVKKNDG